MKTNCSFAMCNIRQFILTFSPQLFAIQEVEEWLRDTQGTKDRATIIRARHAKHNTQLGQSGKYFREEVYDLFE